MFEEKGENVFSLKEGTLYPILHKLEKEGAVESFEKEMTEKPQMCIIKILRQLTDVRVEEEDYTVGEYNIYRLPKFEEFDGVIFDLNNIIHEDVQREIVDRVKKTNVPAISIGREIEGCYYVGIDNYAVMQSMIAHLHESHGCKKYWLIMGAEKNYENRTRIVALKDYMREHNIPFSDEQLYYESFEYQCGVHGFETLYERHKCIPEAIICANDNIAVGVCESVKKHGYSIPNDVIVTGFDNFDKAGYYEPRITTMGHIREETGYNCADLLLRLWSGKEVPQTIYTNVNGVFWESCGCKNDIVRDAKKHLKDQIMYGIETDEFDEEIVLLEYELMKCNTVNEMMHCIPQCIPSMKCDAMYLVMDNHINAFKNQTELQMEQQFMEDEGFHTVGYPETMQVCFAYENGKTLDVQNMQIDNIFPMFDYEKGGESFLFLPLHFRSKTVGYFVIRNAVYLMEKQYLFQVVKTLTTAIENLHKKEKLEYMNQLLSELYITDSMTNMYNRLGYQKLAEKFYKTMHQNGESVLIMFIDLDRLKYINDNFGHELGDLAIVITAKAILKYCEKEGVPTRTGGDEFVLIQKAGSQKEIDEMISNIRKEITEASVRVNFPMDMSVSIGTAVAVPDGQKTLEDYVREADEMMYTEKVKKKVERK